MIGWTIEDWSRAYREGAKPEELLKTLLDSLPAQDVAWISRIDAAGLAAQIAAARARQAAGAKLPLFGVPCAVKDNMDFVGLPTTVACPGIAYEPKAHAPCVASLIEAGAIILGKTNLDQFATGLCGARTPYGAVPNAFDPAYVVGGSSGGSASVVARGLVPFALASDTAGSVRVPAGLNNLIGLKPTRGIVSTTGVYPASRTLDCVSVLATTVADARAIYDLIAGYDEADAYSRQRPAEPAKPFAQAPRFAVPDSPEFFGDKQSQAAYEQALEKLTAFGATCVPISFEIFDAASQLFYGDAFVGERFAALEKVYTEQPDAMLPIIYDIISAAKKYSASDAFNALYKQADLKRRAEHLMADFDALIVPTAPTHIRIADLEKDPIKLNSLMSRYTNFVNILDLSAIALPAAFREDGLPQGITVIGPAFADEALWEFGEKFEAFARLPRGAFEKAATAS